MTFPLWSVERCSVLTNDTTNYKPPGPTGCASSARSVLIRMLKLLFSCCTDTLLLQMQAGVLRRATFEGKGRIYSSWIVFAQSPSLSRPLPLSHSLLPSVFIIPALQQSLPPSWSSIRASPSQSFCLLFSQTLYPSIYLSSTLLSFLLKIQLQYI